MPDILFPPRPKGKMRWQDLPKYENTNWCAQRKFNGTRNLIHIKDGKVTWWSRHGEPHKQFVPSKEITQEVLSLNLDLSKEYWLDGELLNAKTTTLHYKNKVVLCDVLQAGRYFFGGPDLLARYQLLADICRRPESLEPFNSIALQATENIWLAEIFFDNLTLRYKEKLHLPEIEGLVLKRKDSVIDNFGHKEYETGWLIRCRKPTKNYLF